MTEEINADSGNVANVGGGSGSNGNQVINNGGAASETNTIVPAGSSGFSFNKKYLLWGSIGLVVVGIVGFLLYRYFKNSEEKSIQQEAPVQHYGPRQRQQTVGNKGRRRVDPRVIEILKRDPELMEMSRQDPSIIKKLEQDLKRNDMMRMQQQNNNESSDSDSDSDYEDSEPESDTEPKQQSNSGNFVGNLDDLPEGRTINVDKPQNVNENEEIVVETPERNKARDIDVENSREITQCIYVFRDGDRNGLQCENDATHGEYCEIHM